VKGGPLVRETTAPKDAVPKPADLDAAMERIRPHIHHTPVPRCRSIDEHVGARLAFKCENFQKVGAFKFRGVANAVLSLSDEDAATETRRTPMNQFLDKYNGKLVGVMRGRILLLLPCKPQEQLNP
jgi:hypothetical protein